MRKRVTIEPVTRIEGYLKVEVEVERGRVVNAWSSGTMARGFESLLKGKHPEDAPFLVSRVCGLCFSIHQYTSAKALEEAYKLEIPEGARLIRNLMIASEFLYDHIMHFYHFSLLDYIDISRILEYSGKDEELLTIKEKFKSLIEAEDFYPFTSSYKPDDVSIVDPEIVITLLHHYLKALKIQAEARNMGALFGGRQPHYQSIVVGGVTKYPDIERVSKFRAMLEEVADFVKNVYIPDVLVLAAGPLLSFAQSGIGIGYENYLSYGGFELDESHDKKLFRQGIILEGKTDSVFDFDPSKVTESVGFSWYRNLGADGSSESTVFNLEKSGAYSFVKAPRYYGKPVEVGPLARLLISKDENLMNLINDRGLKKGAFLRHVARALEAGILVDQMYVWLDELMEKMELPDFKIFIEHSSHLKNDLEGAAYFEAPRGSLSHFVRVRDGRIHEYRIVGASTWNASPRDDSGQRGQLEEALIGVPVFDISNPLNILRVIRSFNPCLACAVHVVEIDSGKGKLFKS